MVPFMSMYMAFNLYSIYSYFLEGNKDFIKNRKKEYVRDLRRFYYIAIIGVIADMAIFLLRDEFSIWGLKASKEGWEWLLIHSTYLWAIHILFLSVMIHMMPYFKEALMYNEEKENDKKIAMKISLFFPVLTTTLGVVESFFIAVLVVIFLPFLSNHFMTITYVATSIFWWSFMHISVSNIMTEMEYN